MRTTSYTLLQKLVNTSDSSERQVAWGQFARLYTPLLLAWARKQRLQDADAADFIQEVLIRLSEVLPKYQKLEGYKFRNWLFKIVHNLYRDYFTKKQNRRLPDSEGISAMQGIVPPDEVAEMDEREYQLRLTRKCLEVIKSDFSPQTWEAFRLMHFEGWPLEKVVAELKVTDDSVHSGRRRILERLRAELADFLD